MRFWPRWHFRPQHPGTLILIRVHDAHRAKKHAEKRGPYKAKKDYHAAFWGVMGIPITTVLGITIGKIIEKRKVIT